MEGGKKGRILALCSMFIYCCMHPPRRQLVSARVHRTYAKVTATPLIASIVQTQAHTCKKRAGAFRKELREFKKIEMNTKEK